jgi:hypothetical protein
MNIALILFAKDIARMGSEHIEYKLFLSENIPLSLFGDELRIKQILNNL